MATPARICVVAEAPSMVTPGRVRATAEAPAVADPRIAAEAPATADPTPFYYIPHPSELAIPATRTGRAKYYVVIRGEEVGIWGDWYGISCII